MPSLVLDPGFYLEIPSTIPTYPKFDSLNGFGFLKTKFINLMMPIAMSPYGWINSTFYVSQLHGRRELWDGGKEYDHIYP